MQSARVGAKTNMNQYHQSDEAGDGNSLSPDLLELHEHIMRQALLSDLAKLALSKATFIPWPLHILYSYP
jgi:hypothetical protein